jgi:Na+/citrate or Na+/malate symporter
VKKDFHKTSGQITTFTYSVVVWNDISMDFIMGLPKSGNKFAIMIVVNLLSKYAHFCSLQHPFKASMFSQVFMDNIFIHFKYIILALGHSIEY